MDVATAAQMSLIDRLKKFIGEVKVEATKVSWPSRDEVRESTTVVLVTVFIIAMFIYAVDLLISRIVTTIL
jgi:preprotein translocase subunit SecE